MAGTTIPQLASDQCHMWRLCGLGTLIHSLRSRRTRHALAVDRMPQLLKKTQSRYVHRILGLHLMASCPGKDEAWRMRRNSMKSTLQPSGSTTLNPSDGRRNSGASGDSEEDEQERQRSVMTLTPPPLFSIPESGSSSAFVPARSGWNEPRRSTSRNSGRSEGPQRSFSRTSQRSQEFKRSLSRISQRSQGPQRSLSRISQSSPEPKRSTSRSGLARSLEPKERDLPEEPTMSENTTISENHIRDVPFTHESVVAKNPNTHELDLGIFREVSYPPKSND